MPLDVKVHAHGHHGVRVAFVGVNEVLQRRFLILNLFAGPVRARSSADLRFARSSVAPSSLPPFLPGAWRRHVVGRDWPQRQRVVVHQLVNHREMPAGRGPAESGRQADVQLTARLLRASSNTSRLLQSLHRARGGAGRCRRCRLQVPDYGCVHARLSCPLRAAS